MTLKTEHYMLLLAGAQLAGKGGEKRYRLPFCKIKKSDLISEYMP